MSPSHVALLIFAGLPALLLVAYAVGIQYQREAWPQWARSGCGAVAAVALVIDVLANWTVLSVYLLERPFYSAAYTEWTFSQRLERLVITPGWRGSVARPIAALLNAIAPPGHPHIVNYPPRSFNNG